MDVHISTESVKDVRLIFHSTPTKGEKTIPFAVDHFKQSDTSQGHDATTLFSSHSTDSYARSFLARFRQRENTEEFGIEKMAVELGYKSEGPAMLTSQYDPSILDNAPGEHGIRKSPNQESGAMLAESRIITGTIVRPFEPIAVRLGLASRIPINKIGTALEDNTLRNHTVIQSDIYADVGYTYGPFAANVKIDTPLAGGQLNMGGGLGYAPIKEWRFAVSYFRDKLGYDPYELIRVGTEVRPNNDFVIGTNVSSPLHSHDTKSLAVGLYLGTKFF